MPFEIQVSETNKLGMVTGKADVTMLECASAVSQLAVDPKFYTDYALLIDLEQCKPSIKAKEAERFGSFVKRYDAEFKGPIAVLCNKRDLWWVSIVTGISHMVGHKAKPFTKREAAIAYITDNQLSGDSTT